MTNFTSEEEFSALLRQAEPEIRPVETRTIMGVLLEQRATTLSVSQSTFAPTRSTKTHQLFAVTASLLAIVVVVGLLPHSSTVGDSTLAEYQATKAETEVLSAQLERLNVISENLSRQISTTDIRASESLWMLLKEYESDTSSQREQAILIVSLYATTPAADRCRRIFPDL